MWWAQVIQIKYLQFGISGTHSQGPAAATTLIRFVPIRFLNSNKPEQCQPLP